MIDDSKAIIESEKLFSYGELVELAIAYFSKISYHKHRMFCSKMCRGDFESEVVNDGVEYVYNNLTIVNRILLPKERILRTLHDYMVYCITEKVPDGERLPINFFCDFYEKP